MEKEEIRIKSAIVHILDSTIAMPVLSDTLLDHGSDFGDFLRSHIHRIITSDEIRSCSFQKEESSIYHLLMEYKEDDFTQITQKIAGELFQIMNQNADIPPADLIVVHYEVLEEPYMALLKMNYKTSYTHLTDSDPWGNSNDIILQKAILPTQNQRLSEAALISLQDFSIQLLEKKYDINGAKVNYFSTMFLKCVGTMSPKTKLSIITKAVEDIQKKYYPESEQFEVHMESKSILNQELAEEGIISIPKVAEKLFVEHEEMKQEFEEKLEKYHLNEGEVMPKNPNTTKKFERQHLTTDTGIEIKIPMEQYNNKESVEFITNSDGTISVLLKNIGRIVSK
ncbi:MAG TPA: nucleoid-associated protein [Candidatus Merdenecus merdavium]|nr:nucleoid-associated protein [Candidatus Merdenecus merdavium]